jgi:hypothetical protein
MFEELRQKPKDLVLQLHWPVIPAKFAGAKVDLKLIESNSSSNLRHVLSPSSRMIIPQKPQSWPMYLDFYNLAEQKLIRSW